MTPDLLYAFTGLVLFVIGVFGMVALQHLLRKLLAFNLMGSGTFLTLVGLAQHRNGADPVVQALVLTGIVVAIAATALALVLIRRYFHLTGMSSLEPDTTDEGSP
ncbi:NADH-quinone oxidoreductase subunit K [Marinobacter sp.]|uniref:NADH-quinone oxidoreductase subunit K n=1 Tax=Marinobacter sp. TaxID=50741 RepID=UPI00356217EE